MVLECVPAQLAELITREIGIPTIGIGAGVHCDGQVLVSHDLLGMFEKYVPSFVKAYANLAPQIKAAFGNYRDEVKNGSARSTPPLTARQRCSLASMVTGTVEL